jgi:hypothetical protein
MYVRPERLPVLIEFVNIVESSTTERVDALLQIEIH